MKISEIIKRYYPRELLFPPTGGIGGERLDALLGKLIEDVNHDLEGMRDERRLFRLSDIVVDEGRFQSRRDISAAAVESYAQAYLNGADMPPVDIASLEDGRLYLIDGFHRFCARRRLGAELAFIDAVSHRNMTEAEARFFSVCRNMKNGLPLRSRGDREKAFVIYVETGRYRYPNGLLKSYREMAEELTFFGKDSVWRYMTELFPDIAARLSKRYGDRADDAPPALPRDGGAKKKTAVSLLKTLKRAGERAAEITDDDGALEYERRLFDMLNASRARWKREAIKTEEYAHPDGDSAKTESR
ncbi:MAG: hypothetical protein Q4D58_04510 [Synergistaceae bacterium]|nr:hypothetical protein [Synergistaceae bacterium]